MIKVCGFVTFSERRSVFIKNLQLGLIYFSNAWQNLKKNTFNHIKKQSSVTEINYILVLGLIQGIIAHTGKKLKG